MHRIRSDTLTHCVRPVLLLVQRSMDRSCFLYSGHVGILGSIGATWLQFFYCCLKERADSVDSVPFTPVLRHFRSLPGTHERTARATVSVSTRTVQGLSACASTRKSAPQCMHRARKLTQTSRGERSRGRQTLFGHASPREFRSA